MVDFKSMEISKEDLDLIKKIGERAEKEIDDCDKTGIMMDITTVNYEMGLRLNDLLSADGFNFAHDVCGINRHLDRENGKLLGCFLPRFSK